MTDIGGRARQLGHQANGSNALEWGARLGMVAYGVMHLVLAWLAVELALGQHKKNASQQGAMQALAHQPVGPLLLWVIVVGMFLLVLWRLSEVFGGHQEYRGGKKAGRRLKSAGRAVVYAYIGYLALQYALGGSSSSNTDKYTSKLMNQPFGPWLVALVGVAIVCFGIGYIYQGWTDKFLKNLDARGTLGDTGTAYRIVGKLGYIAKGAAFCVLGGLFVAAGLTHKAKKSGGLDKALHTVLQQPFGPVLLIAIAVGIACYGLFCFAMARHLSSS